MSSGERILKNWSLRALDFILIHFFAVEGEGAVSYANKDTYVDLLCFD